MAGLQTIALRRSWLLAGLYFVGFAYAALHPLHYYRTGWMVLWAGYPELPSWLFSGSLQSFALVTVLAVPFGALLAAGMAAPGDGQRWRNGWRWFGRWLGRWLALWLVASALLLAVAVAQILFIDRVLPRLDPRALVLGVAVGMVGWRSTGSVWRLSIRALRDGLVTAWQAWFRDGMAQRLALTTLAWTIWLVAGQWAWQAARGYRDWLPDGPFWWWSMLLLGLFAQAALRADCGPRELWGRRLTLAVLLALVALALLVLAPPRGALADELTPLLQQQGGLLLGAVLAVLASFASQHFGLAGMSSRLALALTGGGVQRGWWLVLTLLLLLPLSGRYALGDLDRAWDFRGLDELPMAVVEQFYAVIKSAILWVPVGLLYSFAGGVRASGRWAGWAVAALLGLPLLTLPWLPQWPLQMLFEFAAAAWGLLAGAWMARYSVADGMFADEPAPGVDGARQAAVVGGAGQAASATGAAGAVVGAVAGQRRAQAAEPVAPAAVPGTAGGGFRSRPAMAAGVGGGAGGSTGAQAAPSRWRTRDRDALQPAAMVAEPARFRSRDATRVAGAAPPAGSTTASNRVDPPSLFTQSPAVEDVVADSMDDGAPAAAPADTPAPAASPAALPSRPTRGWLLGVWAGRVAALLLMALVALLVMDFPRWPLALGVGLTLLALLLWRWPAAALLLVPLALPVLDLAPWSGRFYIDVFDLVVLVTLAMALARLHPGSRLPRLPRLLLPGLALVTLAWVAALLQGLLPLSPWDANATANYWSSYNALRVFKGFAGALVMLLVLQQTLARGGVAAIERWLLPGLWLGLTVVAVLGIREHSLFVGFGDLDAPYRVTGGFSSMHTGGGHIEAWLVMVVPFLWLWRRPFASLARNPLWLLAGVLLLLSAAYLTLITASRGGVAALAVAAAVLALGLVRQATIQHRLTAEGEPGAAPAVTAAANGGSAGSAGAVIGVVSALLLVGGLVALSGSGYLGERLSNVDRDFDTRLDHWSRALQMRDDGLDVAAIGMGLGRFPVTYLQSPLAVTHPSVHRYLPNTDSSGLFLRVGSGETRYLAQRVALQAGAGYRLTLRARSLSGNAELDTPLCEKQLLDSRRCQWNSIAIDGDGQWHDYERWIEPGAVGAGPWWGRLPVELALVNTKPGTVVDVQRVSLLGPGAADVLYNGDFAQGGDNWFFKTHDHLPWHIKNLPVEVLFEQGWLGVVALLVLLLSVLLPLLRRLWAGEALATVVVAAIAGFLTVGLVASLFDAPRLTLLFFMLLFLGALSGPKSSSG